MGGGGMGKGRFSMGNPRKTWKNQEFRGETLRKHGKHGEFQGLFRECAGIEMGRSW